MTWSVYIILCSDDTLYTGISNDVIARYQQHQSGQGAKYFRGRSPQQLVYVENGHDRSSATKREMTIKKLNREQKWGLIESALNQIETVD
jgi:putative endonuclease